MANGGKKKNKKSEGRKETPEEKILREQEEEKLRSKSTSEAKNTANMEMEEKKMMNQMGTSMSRENMEEWSKKKKNGDNNEDKRANDTKRRDSLGGSVSTSSNSSGTDNDEVVSEASKSQFSSPQSDHSVEEATSPLRLPVADLHSTIRQVAQSVVEAGTVDALSTLSSLLPITEMPPKRLYKAGARNLAIPNSKPVFIEDSAEVTASRSASCTPRQVVTPVSSSGGLVSPVDEESAFRSISHDHPAEMPEATPKTDGHSQRIQPNEMEYRILPHELVSEMLPLKENSLPFRGPQGGTFPMMRNFRQDPRNDAFFHGLVRSSITQQVNGHDPSFTNNGGENIPRETVKDKPKAYNSLIGPSAPQQEYDIMGVQEKHLVTEKSEGLWLKGERAVLKHIFDDVPKLLARQKVPWIRELLQLIFDGRPKKVHGRMRVMMNMLRRKEEFADKDDAHIFTHIAATLLEAGTNSQLGYSFVHVLSGQGSHQESCVDTGHKRCMTLQLMLGALSKDSLQKALSLKTREWRNRTPVHYATSTGQCCQLDILQKFQADCSSPDDLAATPIVFAVIRDNLLMLRMLSWYGADLMQTCDKLGHSVLDWVNVTGKFPLGKNCVDFITKRNLAFELALKRWMSEITHLVEVKKSVSDAHTIDCRQPSDHLVAKIPIKKEMVNFSHWIGHTNKTIHMRLRNTIQMEDRPFMYLLIVPFTYNVGDARYPGEKLDTVRQTLFYVDDKENTKPVPLLPDCPFMSVKDPLSTRPSLQKALVPLLMQPNTGTFWAYKIPSDVLASECICLTLSLDLQHVEPILRENLRLLVQAVALHPRH